MRVSERGNVKLGITLNTLHVMLLRRQENGASKIKETHSFCPVFYNIYTHEASKVQEKYLISLTNLVTP